jgi:hypothetical protein
MKSQTKQQKLPWKTTLATEKPPPQDLINWIKIEDKKTRKTRWQNRKKRDRMEKRHKKDEKMRPGRSLQVTSGLHHGNGWNHKQAK